MKFAGDYKYLIGIDEAGRGPLAGPVSVGAVAVLISRKKDFDKFARGVKDSKQLSADKREEWFEKMKKAKTAGLLNFSYSMVGSEIIDRRGIVFAIKKALKSCLDKLGLKPEECFVVLDGSLKAPKKYSNQKTIIGGDAKIPIISLASIVAKVKRDRKMSVLAKIHKNYMFEVHKGYGTAEHYKLIKKFGLCVIHRRSFLQNQPNPKEVLCRPGRKAES